MMLYNYRENQYLRILLVILMISVGFYVLNYVPLIPVQKVLFIMAFVVVTVMVFKPRDMGV